MLVSISALKEQFGRVAEEQLVGAYDACITDKAILAMANSTDVPVVLGRGINRATTWMTHKGAEFVVVCNESDAVIRDMLHHELIHVDQMQRGDLVFGSFGCYWKGDFYVGMETPIMPTGDVSMEARVRFLLEVLKYIALPWEWEATLPTLDTYVGPQLANSIREIYGRFGTTWKYGWCGERFVSGVLVRNSLKDGIIAASGISY